jgi:hypothetical protein
VRFGNESIFYCNNENALAFYNAGVVAVNSKVVVLGPVLHPREVVLFSRREGHCAPVVPPSSVYTFALD